MKKIIVASFLLGTILLILPHKESYVEPITVTPTPPAPVVIKKAIVRKVVHKRAVFTAPPERVVTIAQRVATATGYPVQTITKIIWAESRYNSSATHLNDNKTTDYGLFQINSGHILLAKSMGIDIFTDNGNAQFAIYLIKKNGLRDWSASKTNWE